MGLKCQRLLLSTIGIPGTSRISKLSFYNNKAAVYGDEIATEPQKLLLGIRHASTQTAFVPGLDVLGVSITVYDDLKNQIKRSDLVCMSRVCGSSQALASCSDLSSIVSLQFHLMDATGAFVIDRYNVPCSLGADGIYIQVALVSYDDLLQSTRSIQCLPCGKGQSMTVDTANNIWYCIQCASNQYVLDSNNASYGCQNCPSGAICDGNSLKGQVDGSVWERDYNLGQYLLISCPPGYQMITYTGTDLTFTHVNQQCSKCSSNQFILNSSSSKYRCQECPIGAVCNGSSLTGLVPGSIWRADVNLGQYVLISCPPGYEVSIPGMDSYSSYLNQQCLLCKAGWYCLGGADFSNVCRSGTFSSPGANSSGACTAAVFVQVNLLLPMKKSNFAEKETNFKTSLAEVFQTLEYSIVVDEIISRIYLRAIQYDAIEIQCKIAVNDQSQASDVIEKARNPELSRALLLNGLPPCEILFAAILSSGDDLNPVQLRNLILALGLIIGALLIMGTVLCWSLTKRRTENRDAIILRMKVSEIRSKLLIGRKNGFILQNERVPFLTKTKFVFMNLVYIEAAANIELKKSFDLRHFDAFCHCFESDTARLLSEKVLMSNISSPQYEALCSWLLQICKDLIDPNAGTGNNPSSDGFASAPKNSRERYAYFEKICTAQIWKNDDGKLFKELKLIANQFMESISQECDARFESIRKETRGSDLVSLPSWPLQPAHSDSDPRTAPAAQEDPHGGIHETQLNGR